MLLTPMRYKDYTWPHNPETYSVEYRRQVVVHKVPFGQYVLQDVGETCRIFQGEVSAEEISLYMAYLNNKLVQIHGNLQLTMEDGRVSAEKKEG